MIIRGGKDIGRCAVSLSVQPKTGGIESESEILKKQVKVKLKETKSEVKKSKIQILAAALFPSVFSQTPGSEGNPVIFHNTARDSCSEEQDILKYSLKVSHPRCIGFTMHLDKCI